MQCRYCGSNIPDNSRFCPECGSAIIPQPNPQQTQYQYQQPPQQQPPQQDPRYGFGGNQYQAPDNYNPYAQDPVYRETSSKVASAMVLGLVSIIAGFFVPLAAWICGGIGLSRLNDVSESVLYYPRLQADSEKAHSRCIIGIIVGGAVFIITAGLRFLIKIRHGG